MINYILLINIIICIIFSYYIDEYEYILMKWHNHLILKKIVVHGKWLNKLQS